MTFTNNIEGIFDNQIYVKKLKLLPNEITYLKRIASFTNPECYERHINKKEIGQCGGGKDKLNGKLDIANVQALLKEIIYRN